MIAALYDWPTRRPRLILALALLATLLAIAFCLRLKPETSIEGLLDPTDPAVHALGRVLDRFPVIGEMQVLVSLPDGAPDDRSRLLAFADRFAAAATGHNEIVSVTYRPAADMTKFVTDFVVPNAIYYLDGPQHDAALQRLTRAGMDEQLLRTRSGISLPGPVAGGVGKAVAKTDPLRLFEFITPRLARMLPGGMGASAMDPSTMGDPSHVAFFSPNGRNLLIRVVGREPPGDLRFCHEITQLTHRLIDATNTDGLTVEVGGAYAVASFSSDAIRHDAIVGVNGSIIGIGVLFLLLYRRPLRMFAFAFTPMAMGIACGFGALAILKPTLTPLAAVVGGALGGIGIDYLVFYLVHHDQDRATIADRSAATSATSRRLRGALRTAWLTSVVGFVAVGWSPIHVLRDFALLGTLALGGAYVATTLVLPAVLVTFDRQRRPLAATRTIAFIRPIGRFIARWPVGVAIGAVILCFGAVGYLLIAGRSLAPASDLTLLHPRPNPPLETQRHISRVMQIAPGSLQLYLQADSSTQLVQLAHEVDRRLRESDTVQRADFAGTFSLASVLPDPKVAAGRQAELSPQRAEQVARDLPAAIEQAGFNPASFAAYSQFVQRLVSPSAPPTLDGLRAYPSVAHLVLPRDAVDVSASQPAEVRDGLCMVFFHNALDHREQRDAAINAVEQAVAGIDAAGNGHVTVTGIGVTSQHVESTIHRDLPKLTLAAVIWIALCHAVHFRSIGLALLSMVPTAISALAVLVYMTHFDEPLNLVNMVMVPLLLGIDTDYGILTVAAYQSAGGSRRRLLRAFPSAVSAVVTCACTTIIGFGSLVLVSIPAVQSLGWLINVGIVSCLLGTIVGVWPVMFWMAGRRKAPESS